MKQFIEKNKERRKLIKQGFKQVHLCYNHLSNYWIVLIYSKEFIQKRFKSFEIVI
jgi:hypothetical protein